MEAGFLLGIWATRCYYKKGGWAGVKKYFILPIVLIKFVAVLGIYFIETFHPS
ncbi:ABC transporter [Neisseria lactamica]|uniref:ABC transporter n=1 Tax=Neisseria lactamica TaxID=486 RepID=UPI000E578166|nr:ABC transporter [Neisseria lactamica]